MKTLKALGLRIVDWFAAEPVLSHTACAAVATVVVGVAARFGLRLDAAQIAAVLVVVAPAATMAAGVIARQKVSPTPAKPPAA